MGKYNETEWGEHGVIFFFVYSLTDEKKTWENVIISISQIYDK
jgi:hypothetical protein